MRFSTLMGLVSGFALLACGDDDPARDTGDACVGSCSKDSGRGSAGRTADGGTGGAGRGGGGGVGPRGELCDGTPLAEYCARHTCAASPDAVVQRICSSKASRSYFIQSNDCGGKTVREPSGPSAWLYHFDDMGSLVGVTWLNDTIGPGCVKLVNTYGMRCAVVGPTSPATCGGDRDAGADDSGI